MVKIVEISMPASKKSKPKTQNKANKQLAVRSRNVGLSNSQMVLAPVAKAVITRTRQPKFQGPAAGGAVRVSHREYIADINGTASFTTTTGNINPGLSGLFPWLSQFGLAYESYSFRKLRFVLEPIAATSSAGQIMMAIDYDAADAAPSSKVEILQYKGASCGPLWNEQICVATGKDESSLSRRRYVRSGDLAANLDIKTYDIGNLFVSSSGAASTIAAAALFVEYDVEFFTPQYSLSAFAAAYSRKVVAGGTISKTAFLGDAATVAGGLAVTGTGNTLTFAKAGQYLLDVLVNGTGLTVAPTVTGTATTTAIASGLNTSAGNTVGKVQYVVNVLEAGLTAILDWSANTTVTGAAVRIAPYLVSLL